MDIGYQIVTIESNPDYKVDNLGNIFNKHGKKLKPRLRRDTGYYAVILYNPTKSYLVHKLVGKYFVPNPENKPFLNHKRGNKALNAHYDLEWCTASENLLHSYRTLGRKPTYNKSSLCIKIIHKKGEGENIFESFNEATRVTGYSRSKIKRFINQSIEDPDGFCWYNK